MKYTVVPVMALGALLAAAGCSATGAESSEPTARAEQAIAPWLHCAGDKVQSFKSWDESGTECNARAENVALTSSAVHAAKARSGRLLKYVLGGPTPSASDVNVPDTGAGASVDKTKQLKARLCMVRQAVLGGDIDVSRSPNNTGAHGMVPAADSCQEDTVELKFVGTVNWGNSSYRAACTNSGMGTSDIPSSGTSGINDVIMDITRAVRVINGWCQHAGGAPTFFGTENQGSLPANVAYVDPGPAQLSGGLSGSSASAAASYTDGSGDTTAYQFPPRTSTPTPCNGAQAGMTCNTSATSAGSTVYGTVCKYGPNCKCALGTEGC